MTHTQQLAAFCAGVSFNNLPAEVIEKTKLCILDFAANVYGSLELDAVRRVADYVRGLGGPDIATAMGCGFKTGAHNAAFMNGTAAEAIEAQDGLRFGGNHPGTAVIPAVLAIAEQQKLSGRAIIEAVVAGYEAANRIAAAMHPHHTLGGFLPTGTTGAFGAAAAVSRLMRHDAETMAHSLGAAGFLAPVSMAEHLMGGFTSKIVQGGQGASAGLTAAGLAQAGITAPPYTLEGSHLKGGFTLITTRGQNDISRITDGLGQTWSMMDIYLKPYTACRHTHGAAQATLELVAENEFNLADIEAINVFSYAIASVAVGKAFTGKESFVTAQFSLPYVVAACLVDRAMGPEQLTESRLRDPAISALAARVKINIDGALQAMYPDKTASRVQIKLADGRELVCQVDTPLGDPRAPMSPQDVADKLAKFAARLDKSSIDSMVDQIMHLEKIENVNTLTSMM
jgi:2-methylcitrate dehydratase PrpD